MPIETILELMTGFVALVALPIFGILEAAKNDKK